jgi:catechol 2,3-dioxygenase-like lactoylglutathione lyase family enzyme
MHLNQITIGSTDLERSEKFYRRLGLRLIVKDDGYLRFECPDLGSTFSVELVGTFPQGEQVTIYFESDHLDSEYERLCSLGTEFAHPPTDMPWLWREARLRDPDGHRICIYRAGENRRNPPWRLASG